MAHAHHDHHHHHHHHGEDVGDRRVAAAVAINLGLTVVQIVGGILAGSLALIADALHNLSDAVTLVIAFAARRIARRPADGGMTFGYGRAETVAALVNLTTLVVIGAWLAGEAVMRFFDPPQVEGWPVVWIAAVALVVDVATALLTFPMSKGSANIRAAFLHNLADALGSVAVIVAGTAILLWDWRLADPIATLGISAYILWMAFREFGGVARLLMMGSPPGIETRDVLEAVRGVRGVEDVHQAYLWMVDEQHTALDAHLVIEAGRWSDADDIKAEVKALIGREFDILQSTLEMECSAHACEDAPMIGAA